MAVKNKNTMLVIAVLVLMMVICFASMEFAGSYAWFVKKLELSAEMPEFKMGEVTIEVDYAEITNASTVPIILRARVVIEPDEFKLMDDGEYFELTHGLDFGFGWEPVQGEDGGIFLIYTFGDALKDSDDDDDVPEQAVIMPEVTKIPILPVELPNCTITIIFEALQATQMAYETAWEGDYKDDDE
jgi:hypothetical protein